MKPSFALNLTETGLTLLHRTARGWMDVGSVSFDHPDLGGALEDLRSTALGLSQDGMTTKLIIPDSQILYLDVQAAGPDDASRRAQIEAALDGRTPYALHELAYDWSAEGSQVRVAVVARETLAEAEAFAVEHRLNPLCFVARPEAGFDREPFFGASDLAPSLMPSGDVVEADALSLVTVASDAETVVEEDPQPAVEAEAAQGADPAPEVQSAPEPEPQQLELPDPVWQQPEPEAPPAADAALSTPMTDAGAEPLPDVTPAAAPEGGPGGLAEGVIPVQPLEMPTAEVVAAPSEPEPPVQPEPLRAPPAPFVRMETAPAAGQWAEPEPKPLTPPPATSAPEPQPPSRVDTLQPAQADEAEAPMAVDVPQEEVIDDVPPLPSGLAARTASVLSAQSPPLDDIPPPPSAAVRMSFASRRAADSAARPLGAALPASESGAPDLGAARPEGPAPRVAPPRPAVERPAGAKPAPKFSYDDPVPPPPRMPGDPPVTAGGVMGKAGKGLRSRSTLVTAPSIPGTRAKKAPAAPAPGPVSPPVAVAAKPVAPASTLAAPVELAAPGVATMKAAAQTLSRSGTAESMGKGLGSRTMPQRGKPKYLGLVLTGILLLLLAIVAAWSSFYLTRASDPAEETQVAGLEPGIDPESIAEGQLPAPEDEMLADQQDPALLDPSTDPDQATAILAPEPVTPDAVVPEPATPEAAAAVPPAGEPVAAAPIAEPAPQTGVQDVVATETPPGSVTQDEIYLAGMDAPPALNDPLVLPQPSVIGDSPPAAQMPPPPFGTVYQFDADGRIKPTAEGIVTPEGVTLVSGRPSVVPPQRPATLAPAVAAAPAPDVSAAAAEPAATPGDATLRPEETFAADPSLSDARPRVRPEGLAPVAPTADDDASLAPAQDSRFASLRPRLRPAEILAAGEEARRASESASLAMQAAAQAAAEAAVASAADANVSALAVSVSRVPAPRPRDLSRAVEVAVAAATRQPDARRPAAEPEADPEPKAGNRAEEEADEEPEVASRSAAPRIPTKANVAKQATFVNAINLSKVNLIGVYGTQSKRYALIRQANGRYKKVRVGDSVDGGRVQAITASEVRYQKGGRILSLALPKG